MFANLFADVTSFVFVEWRSSRRNLARAYSNFHFHRWNKKLKTKYSSTKGKRVRLRESGSGGMMWCFAAICINFNISSLDLEASGAFSSRKIVWKILQHFSNAFAPPKDSSTRSLYPLMKTLHLSPVGLVPVCIIAGRWKRDVAGGERFIRSRIRSSLKIIISSLRGVQSNERSLPQKKVGDEEFPPEIFNYL